MTKVNLEVIWQACKKLCGKRMQASLHNTPLCTTTCCHTGHARVYGVSVSRAEAPATPHHDNNSGSGASAGIRSPLNLWECSQRSCCCSSGRSRSGSRTCSPACSTGALCSADIRRGSRLQRAAVQRRVSCPPAAHLASCCTRGRRRIDMHTAVAAACRCRTVRAEAQVQWWGLQQWRSAGVATAASVLQAVPASCSCTNPQGVTTILLLVS